MQEPKRYRKHTSRLIRLAIKIGTRKHDIYDDYVMKPLEKGGTKKDSMLTKVPTTFIPRITPVRAAKNPLPKKRRLRIIHISEDRLTIAETEWVGEIVSKAVPSKLVKGELDPIIGGAKMYG